MLPWLFAITPSAAKRASTTCWLVSTLPATTAAGGCGFSIEPSGTMICSGVQQAAEHIERGGVDHRGRGVEVGAELGAGTGEVEHRLPASRIDAGADHDL